MSRYGNGYPTSERTHFEFLQVVLVRCCKMRSSFDALPESVPELGWPKLMRVLPDPYLRFDTND